MSDSIGLRNMTDTATLATPRTPQTERVMSIDALRGFDMFWILGADSLVYALNRMTQTAPTKFLATQLEHAEWEYRGGNASADEARRRNEPDRLRSP